MKARKPVPVIELASDPTSLAEIGTNALATQSGGATAKIAAGILARKDIGFLIPTPAQKRNLVVAFAKRDMIIYGKAFDVVRVASPLNLDDLASVEENLDAITVCEIKSTKKALAENFAGFFFALTAAEVLVAQSLKKRFKFLLVNTQTEAFLEVSLNEIFGRARGIYPTWSILF